MRFEWTAEAYARVEAQGLRPAEVHDALRLPGPRLLRPVGDDTLGVIVRTPTRRLVEVWLVENPDDGVYEIFAAFEAGFLGTAKWKNAFGQEER